LTASGSKALYYFRFQLYHQWKNVNEDTYKEDSYSRSGSPGSRDRGHGLYHAYLRPEALRNLVQRALETKLQKKIVIKNFEIDVLNRPRVTLDNISLSGDGGYVMQADRVIARFSPWYLLLGRLEINDVSLKNPHFTIDFEKITSQGESSKLPRIRLTGQCTADLQDPCRGSVQYPGHPEQ